MLKQLYAFVVIETPTGLSKKQMEDLQEARETELRDRVAEMNDLTDSLVSRVKEILSNRRIIGYTFIFDGMDYC
jgi:hypothetical protein